MVNNKKAPVVLTHQRSQKTNFSHYEVSLVCSSDSSKSFSLPQWFKEAGFDYTLLDRHGDIALLLQTRADWKTPHYEVVRIRHTRAGCINGKSWPAREAMPRSESWGIDGFSFLSLEQARAKFRAMAGAPDCPNPHDSMSYGASLELGRVNTADSAGDALVTEGGKE